MLTNDIIRFEQPGLDIFSSEIKSEQYMYHQIINIATDRPEQTVKTKIRLVLKEYFDEI